MHGQHTLVVHRRAQEFVLTSNFRLFSGSCSFRIILTSCVLCHFMLEMLLPIIGTLYNAPLGVR